MAGNPPADAAQPSGMNGMMVLVAIKLKQEPRAPRIHHLLLLVACGKEILNGSLFRIAALADNFHQGHESIELGVWDGHVVTNSCVVMLVLASLSVPPSVSHKKALDVFGRRKDAVYIAISLI